MKVRRRGVPLDLITLFLIVGDASLVQRVAAPAPQKAENICFSALMSLARPGGAEPHRQVGADRGFIRRAQPRDGAPLQAAIGEALGERLQVIAGRGG